MHTVCTATKILEKRRQAAEVQDALDAQKHEFLRKVDVFQRREDAIRRKDLMLQESLIKFNKFLQENEYKRTRALRRCTDEKLACKIKEKEISQISETLETKKKEEQNISITLNENRRFHVFLKRVVEEGTFDNFSEIQDILDRYRTLKSTNDDLMAQMQKNTEQHEERRSSYMHFMKFGSNEMLRKNNEIVGLQKEMEKVTMMHNNIENLNDGTNRNAIEMTTDISQILVVIGNLAERLKSRAHPSQRRKENAKKDFASRSFIEEDDPTVAIEMKKKKAMTNLEIITDYIVDYQNIAHGWQLMRGVTAEL